MWEVWVDIMWIIMNLLVDKWLVLMGLLVNVLTVVWASVGVVMA